MDRTKQVTSNLLWRFLERFGAQGVTFVVSLVIARLLEPEIYGYIALVTVITSILQVFVDSGFGTALVQKKNADHLDFSTVFFFNLVFCVILYVLLYIFAPIIATIYKNQELTSVIRVLGLIVIISGLKNIQQAYVSRNLLFKKFFFATLSGTVGAAIIGIWMAYNGFGIWAIVAQYLFNAAVDTVILWIIVPWRPKAEFSFERLKILFSYGSKLLVSTLLDKFWIQLRQLIIGIKYSTEDLAFYNKGHEFPEYGTIAINSSIDSVLLPVMSQAQDSEDLVKNMTRKAIRISSYVMWPVMMGLAACAEPLIRILITEKWIFAVPYLRIFCITYAFYPVHTANLNAIKAMGRSDVFLKLEIIKKIVNLAIILSSMWFGVFIMALSTILSSVLGQIINSWPNRKLLKYRYIEQLKDLSPAMVLSMAMAVIVYSVQLFHFSDFFTLLIQIPLGVVIYIIGSKLFHFEQFNYCKRMVCSIIYK